MTLHTGACPHCNVVGVRCANSMVYPSALALVPANSPARALWHNHPFVRPDASLGRAGSAFNEHVEAQMRQGLHMQTTALAVASGRRALLATTKAAAAQEPFKGVSVYCTLFPGVLQAAMLYFHTLSSLFSSFARCFYSIVLQVSRSSSAYLMGQRTRFRTWPNHSSTLLPTSMPWRSKNRTGCSN